MSAEPLPGTGHLRATHEHAFTLALPPAEAFTFFEPIGEKRWASDWDPRFPVPEDAQLHDGSVFTVLRPAEGGATLESVWTITRYAPPLEVEYANVLVGVRATRITVRCDPAPAGATRVGVRYVYTGLSDAGDREIAGLGAAAYREMIESWGADIAAYLERGTPATP
ncbi:MAG: SRPBCC family protein [Vicinamibacteria bacterium]